MANKWPSVYPGATTPLLKSYSKFVKYTFQNYCHIRLMVFAVYTDTPNHHHYPYYTTLRLHLSAVIETEGHKIKLVYTPRVRSVIEWLRFLIHSVSNWNTLVPLYTLSKLSPALNITTSLSSFPQVSWLAYVWGYKYVLL